MKVLVVISLCLKRKSPFQSCQYSHVSNSVGPTCIIHHLVRAFSLEPAAHPLNICQYPVLSPAQFLHFPITMILIVTYSWFSSFSLQFLIPPPSPRLALNPQHCWCLRSLLLILHTLLPPLQGIHSEEHFSRRAD